jgi:hypothetical protein
MIEPAVAALGGDCPPADRPLLALARRMAATIDAMPDAMAGTMLPNHAGPFLKALAELEERARKRQAQERSAGKGNRVRQLQATHQMAKRKRAS